VIAFPVLIHPADVAVSPWFHAALRVYPMSLNQIGFGIQSKDCAHTHTTLDVRDTDNRCVESERGTFLVPTHGARVHFFMLWQPWTIYAEK
jgi:recombinational DNA repair protein (RecF pathway)